MKILIFGAGNVGATAAETLAADNHPVGLVDLSPVETVKSRLRDLRHISFYQADSLDQTRVQEIVDQFNPGVLICAVGTISFDQDKIHYDQFKREFEINFTANIVPIKAALPQMIRRRSGQIIVLSSTSGHHAPHTLASYGPSKWAIENFSSALAAEAKRFGITVDSISPTSIQNIHSQAFKIQGIPAQRVVKRIAKAIRRPKGAGHFVPAQYRLVRLLERLLPWFLNWRAGLALKRRAQFRGAPLESGLITGASSGLGRELALLYARKLKKIFLQGRNLKALEELRTKIHQSCPCEVELRTCDLSDPAQVDEFIKNFPPVDVLVNNAGFHVQAEVKDTDLALTRRVLQVNFFSSVRLIQHFLELERRPRKIINILSTTAIFGRSNLSAYSASKGALWCLTRSIRRLFGNEIQVVEVLPATFKSNLFHAGVKIESPDRPAQPVYGVEPPAAEVAATIVRDVERGREIIFYPKLKGSGILIFECLFPRLIRILFG